MILIKVLWGGCVRVLLVAPDNGSYISTFPLGLGYIAAVLRQDGHYVEIYNKDVYHSSGEQLTQFLDTHDFDVVGSGTCGGYRQYREMKNIAAAVRRAKRDVVFVVGGHLATPEPYYFLKLLQADYIVLGEGEETMRELCRHLENSLPISQVTGLAYRDKKGDMVLTGRREEIEDLDSIPHPAWDLFPMDHYTMMRDPNIMDHERSMLMYSGRGCLFHCNFCYRMEKGLRIRSADKVIEEMRELKEQYNVSYISFYDELLVNSESRVEEFCEKLLDARLDMHWNCNGRLNFTAPKMLRMMKKAGCVFINYGIESLDEQALKTMNKSLTVKQIITGIENTLAAGISPGFNIIWGNIGEDEHSLQLGVDFLLKYDDHSQRRTIRPVTPYPGCPLYYYAIEKGLLGGIEDFYEQKHVNSDLLTVNFTNLTDEEFYAALLKANEVLLANYYEAQKQQMLHIEHDLYINKDADFRGFRTT